MACVCVCIYIYIYINIYVYILTYMHIINYAPCTCVTQHNQYVKFIINTYIRSLSGCSLGRGQEHCPESTA